uniref:C2H2-type domain-containing protein n=1 Tax=Timema cristinae TaxID=61476 RepID=A0A7R9CAL7_TIMCR|nr:unnamed protein product [Timema cristinae]
MEKGNTYAMTNLAQTPMDPKPFQDDIRAESLIESLKYKQCPHCGKRFRFKRHFGKHLDGHKRHDCKLCDTLLSSRQENARHMLERHCIVVASKSLFKCDYCPKKFVKRATLHNHYKKHLVGQDVCLVCGEFVESAEELKAHQNKHEQDKEWQCEQCDQWFARRQQYLIHMKVESRGSVPTFVWRENEQESETQFRENYSLYTQPGSNHDLTVISSLVHCDTPIPKLCTACQLTFHTARSYSHHLNSPGHLKKTSTDTVTCEKCNKSFRSQKVLSQHTQRVHLTTRMFQCDNCDYSTKCKANLARHNVAIHADRKEFICELCGTAFSTLNTLRDHHTYIHSDQRLFPCELCVKTFKRKSELNRHVKIHSDSRPVKCHCGQSYKCVSHLRRHEQKSHNVAKSKKGKKESSSIDRISSKQLNTSKDMSSGNADDAIDSFTHSLDSIDVRH